MIDASGWSWLKFIERLLDDRCEWLILAEVVERQLDDRCEWLILAEVVERLLDYRCE